MGDHWPEMTVLALYPSDFFLSLFLTLNLSLYHSYNPFLNEQFLLTKKFVNRLGTSSKKTKVIIETFDSVCFLMSLLPAK